MARAATSFPDDQLPLLEQRIAALRRPSLSHHIALLLEDDLRACGLLPPGLPAPELAEFMAKVQAAAAASPRIIARLEAALRRELRPAKSAA